MSATCVVPAEMSHMWPCQEMRKHVVLSLTFYVATSHPQIDTYKIDEWFRKVPLFHSIMRSKMDRTNLTFCEIHQWNTLIYRRIMTVKQDSKYTRNVFEQPVVNI